MKKLLLAGLVSLVGCASSSGVIPMGPDTYFISTHDMPGGIGSVGSVEPDALREAGAFCIKGGKQLKVLTSTVRPTKFAGGAESRGARPH